MTISVITLGCKVNECESRSLIAALRDMGHSVSEEFGSSDIYIINTCSVTAEADRKSRQMISRAEKISPRAKIYVCGCSSQNNPSAFEKYKNVVRISGNGKKNNILEQIMSDIVAYDRVCDCAIPKSYENMHLPAHEKTRDFIKIQDGCNNFCSYCIIPYVRGRSRSRDLASIRKEAVEATRHTKEIVLTGIDVSSYGKDCGKSLIDVVKALSDITIRKRLSSFECTVVDKPLLEALANGGFCDHFHLSLQSGTDSVLKSMNRKYTTEKYAEIVGLIREYFPNAGITTDIIAGFPTETEHDFLRTCEFVRSIGFSDMHVFPYSERKGTRAAEMKQLPMEIRRQRAHILGEIKAELKKQFLEKQIGKSLTVYFEEAKDGEAVGYAENYVRVYGKANRGDIKEIKISELYNEGVK